MTTCMEFDAWLNEGMPEPLGAPAAAHAEGCARCRAAWQAARELETALEDSVSMAPAGLTDAVMARIQRTTEARGHAPAALPSAVAWWVQAAEEPASVLAILIAGLVMWKSEAIRASALAMALKVGQWAINLRLPDLGDSFTQPVVTLGLALALLPTALLASWALFHWAEKWAGVHRAA